MEPRSGFRLTSQLVLGAAIAVVGVLFTLDNLHVLHARDYLRFWPVALIAIGLVHVSQAKTAAGTIGGAIWIFAGALLLGNRLGFLHTNIWNFWPLILVLVGARIVWQAMDTTRTADAGDADASVSAIAVMGGFEILVPVTWRVISEVTPLMGGIEDKARSSNNPSAPCLVIRGFMMMGGITLKNS
jgi:hypothetical protein